MQVDPVALKLDLVDLALAVLLAARLEDQHLGVPRELLQGGQQFSNGDSSGELAVYSLEHLFE